jgi:signal transduction histidine kinase
VIKFIRLPFDLYPYHWRSNFKAVRCTIEINNMLKIFIRWFHAPMFPEDEEKTRGALLLNVILNMFLIALPVLFITTILNGYIPRQDRILIMLACAWLIILGTRFIMIVGRVKLASALTIAVLFIITTLAIYNIGTIRTPAVSFYLLIIVTAGLTLGRRAIIWMAGISSLLVFILLLAETNGILSKPSLSVTMAHGLTFTVIFVITSVLLYLAIKSIDESLANSRQKLAERKQSEEREQNRRKVMEQVIRIAKNVTEVSNLRTTLLRIWDGVRNGLDFDRAAIFLYNPEDSMMQGSYGTNRSGEMSEEWDLKFSIKSENSFFKVVLSQPNGYYFTQDYSGERNLNLRPGHPMGEVKYYAAVACWSGDKPMGIICVDQLISGRTITDEQLEALRLFAGYAGLAIENARLNEREQSRQKMMEGVIRIGKEVTEKTTNLRTTLLKIRDRVRSNLGFDRAAIFLYNPQDDILQGSYGTDRSGELSDEWDRKFKPDDYGFLREVLIQHDGFYFTKDYETELNIASIPVYEMWGVKHFAAAACWSGDKPAGIICVDQLISGRAITDEQLEALRLFAGYAGLAIDNARLNSELENRMQERENFIQELGNRNAELERFTYTVSHDLRSPIVTIKGFLGFLEKDIRENRQEKIQTDFQRIENATDKMNSLLSDLLELSRIGRIITPPEEVHLAKLIQDALETIDGRIRAKNIAVHVSPSLPILRGDRVRLREVLENLIDNAAKYMGDQPNPIIEIGAKDLAGEQAIYVKDNGLGIGPQYLTKVFGLFEKLNPTSEGTGIGLALIKRIIEVHGGRVWAESEGSGKGSTFYFTIPDIKKTIVSTST